jgi:hypothetical protein
MVVVDQCVYFVGSGKGVWRLHLQRKRWAPLPPMILGRGCTQNHTVAVHNGQRLVAISSHKKGPVESLVLPSTEGKARPPAAGWSMWSSFSTGLRRYRPYDADTEEDAPKSDAVWQELPPMNSGRDQASLLLC